MVPRDRAAVGRSPAGRRGVRSVGALAVAIMTVVALTAIVAPSASDAAAAKRYAYRVQATYSLTRDAVDPATGLRVSVERRLEVEFRVWAKVSENQVYTGTSGDYAEADGKAVASVRDDRSSPPCSQTVEAKGRIGLKFVTSRAPLTAVWLPWAPGTVGKLPALPCGATDVQQWETGRRGTGDWTRVAGGLAWHESRTRFYADVYANLANGRNAEVSLTFESPRQTAGTTERATVRLVFMRAADLEPKPAAPSGKAVVVSKPLVSPNRYNASVMFAVTRGGDPTRITRATCTGSFTGGPGLYREPEVIVSNLPRVPPNFIQSWPELSRVKGWMTLVQCFYEHEEYTLACGKLFRGSLRLTVDGTRTVVRRFSFPWKAKGYRC